MNYIVISVLLVIIIIVYYSNLKCIENFDNFPYNYLDKDKIIDIDGHKLTISRIQDKPIVLKLYPFLTKKECRYLIDLASSTNFQRSLVVSKNKYSKTRTSYTCMLKKSNNEILKKLENRVAKFCNVNSCMIEPFQVVRYHPNQKFEYHYDWFNPETESGKNQMVRGGQRLYTLFIYLNNLDSIEFEGEEKENHNGNTCFKKNNLCIKPEEGLAVFWKNIIDGKLNYDSLHSGRPPKFSKKYGLNVWIRERCYNSKLKT